ncbi:MAG: peptide chain release factor 1, partial [Mycobacterium sp.]|nr:peptide chain release factor 1 [Mycobacterium sp.]
ASAYASSDLANQIRTVVRSERIRTSNVPENRVTDHRIGYKAHNLDQLLDGDLDALFDALGAADKQSRLQQA